jgi:NDP-sugar pyrophosphorylase family protein
MFRHGVILAAGRGLRMMPMTKKTPKALALFNGQTLVEQGINKLKKDIQNIHITVGYKGTLVASHVISRGVRTVLNTSKKGNAWWIYNTLLKNINEPLLVLTCDNVIDLDISYLKKQIKLYKKAACILVAVNPDTRFVGDYLISKKNRVLKIKRNTKTKSSFYASGIQILNPYLINKLTKKSEDFMNVWKQLIKINKLYHTNIYPKKWLAIDTIEQLKKYEKI